MQFKYNFLAGKIKEIFGTQEKFAEALGISSPSVSKKMQGKAPWKQQEMDKTCKLLHVRYECIPKLFFSKPDISKE